MNSYSKLVVAYEDGDGDWMLLGDIPWEYVRFSGFLIYWYVVTNFFIFIFGRMFVDGSVKRLKIMN